MGVEREELLCWFLVELGLVIEYYLVECWFVCCLLFEVVFWVGGW